MSPFVGLLADQVTPVSDVLCEAWARLVDVPSEVRADIGDDQLLGDQLVAASEILYALSGRRWRGRGCRATVTLEAKLPAGPLGERRGLLGVRRGQVVRRQAREPDALWLPDWPVTAVVEVVDDNGDAVDPAGYRLVDSRRVERLDDTGRRVSWDACEYTVTYEFGAAPPRGGVTAAVAFAVEMSRALLRKPCRLPQRVTSVTRQGVTVAVIDRMEFIEKSRTGLPDVDAWLTAVNPKGQRSRPSVYSPDLQTRRPSHRTPPQE